MCSEYCYVFFRKDKLWIHVILISQRIDLVLFCYIYVFYKVKLLNFFISEKIKNNN